MAFAGFVVHLDPVSGGIVAVYDGFAAVRMLCFKERSIPCCNILQNGDATFSIFVLQLSVLLLCNKHYKLLITGESYDGAKLTEDIKRPSVLAA